MVFCRNHFHHHHHLAILFLLISITTTFSHVSCSQLAQEEVKAAVRSLIGSRPPRCDQVAMRCKNCGGGGGGHCEAVQVPIDDTTANQKKHSRPFHNRHHLLHSKAMAAAAYSAKGGGNSNAGNYKPMCWKCKCGNLIFNP